MSESVILIELNHGTVECKYIYLYVSVNVQKQKNSFVKLVFVRYESHKLFPQIMEHILLAI